MSGFRTTLPFMVAGLACGAPTIAFAQNSGPFDWRDITYADLRLPSDASRSYAEIWADRLSANNEHYARAGDARFAAGNAPAVASAFVIRSPTKVVVLSVFNAVSACKTLQRVERAQVTVKRCPMRLAIYGQNQSGGIGSVLDAGEGCFLEFGDPRRAFTSDREAGSYAAYDLVTRTIRTGLVIGGQAIAGCDLVIPIPRGG
ncbi:MAG: hypothetical protein ACRCUE_07080 [Bosea sp. (in: a-proteobacteria)]